MLPSPACFQKVGHPGHTSTVNIPIWHITEHHWPLAGRHTWGQVPLWVCLLGVEPPSDTMLRKIVLNRAT